MLEKKVQEFISRYPHKALTRRDIAEKLGLHGGERKRLTAILRRLVSDGVLEEKRGCYRLGTRQLSIEGTLALTERGFGFVRPEQDGLPDLFIGARDLGDAMQGDLVTARQVEIDRSGRPYGRIVKVLQRAHSTLLGIYHQQRDRAWVVPLEQELTRLVYVQREGSIPAQPGQVVMLELVRYPTAKSAGSGRVVEVLGEQDDPQVDIETVIRKFELPHQFSPKVVQEAEQSAARVVAKEIAQRVDLRDLPLMTIDGETARDYDDAVVLRREPGEGYRLWVCIADVAHYVNEGESVDCEARERGTSVYFPGFCLPMLPESLSNGSCSLNPDEDRLVMVAELRFDRAGRRSGGEFYPAVIRSRARLTYNQVADFLTESAELEAPEEVLEQLPTMAELAEKLEGLRSERGSLELDLPDVEIILDESGFPRAISRSQRTVAHRLIEEFMLAANEAVAEFLERHNYHFLYRIHERPAPEKLQEFQQLAAECGFGLVLNNKLQQQLQALLEEISERPEARLLNQQLLRSLQQARYSPQNQGHFGLAATSYCHFTSPIRRYPDLLVHRTLKRALVQPQREKGPVPESLVRLGRECSDKERRAMAAERDLLELRRCQLMQDRVGEVFNGILSSVTEFGFFVELDELFVEGLVHVRSLDNDFYVFDPCSHTLTGERRRRQFRVGMRAAVRVEKVDLGRRRLDFTLVEIG